MRASQNTMKKVVVDHKEIIDQTYILEHIREFYETLLKTREQKTAIKMEKFFISVNIPKLSENQAKLSEEDSIEKDLFI